MGGTKNALSGEGVLNWTRLLSIKNIKEIHLDPFNLKSSSGEWGNWKLDTQSHPKSIILIHRIRLLISRTDVIIPEPNVSIQSSPWNGYSSSARATYRAGVRAASHFYVFWTLTHVPNSRCFGRRCHSCAILQFVFLSVMLIIIIDCFLVLTESCSSSNTYHGAILFIYNVLHVCWVTVL